MSYHNGPRIVTNGLVLYLDAGNSKSYPGSGTTWNDLSGNSNNGTLNSGAFYNTLNGGNITFDGTNDRVECASNFSSVINGLSNFTISCLVYPENTQNQFANIWGNHADSFIGIVCQQNSNNLNQYYVAWGTGSAFVFSNNFQLNTQRWNNLCCVRNGTNFLVYINGIIASSSTISASISPNTNLNFQIGIGYNTNSTRYFKGRIANFSIYNRNLSASEVIQNHNALKGRFQI